MRNAIKSFFAFIGLGSLLSFFFLYPSEVKKRELKFFHVLDEDEIPQRGVKRTDFSYEQGNRVINTKTFIVMTAKGLIAFSPVCTHLGCLVNWDRNKNEFLCPCHGGRYDKEGNVIAGPPLAPLAKLPIQIKDGKVLVGIKV
ncbi:MAG: Rieske 2Fe-2S domain-containing protein [Nitrospirae bacterium]|nr:Rieske 2Fe-2S domain-containing protein [Nitrospirota bacterium]